MLTPAPRPARLPVAARVGAVDLPIPVIVEVIVAALDLAETGGGAEAVRIEAVDLGVTVIVPLVVAHLGLVPGSRSGRRDRRASAGSQPCCQRDGEKKS